MVFDLHNDFLTAVREADKNAELQSYADAGLRGCAFAVWTSEVRPDFESFGKYALPQADFVCRLAVEDLGSVATDDYAAFMAVYRPFYASLTWNGDNPLAGGTGCEKPLTAKGRRALAAMNAAAVPLDLAHLSDTAFYDALDRADRMLVTHTASRALSGHPRCVTDAMAKLVAERGGLIGVAAVPDFLDGSLVYGDNCSRDAYARHICRFVEAVGADYVAVGTDFNGAEYFPRGLTSYADFGGLQNDLLKYGLSAEETAKIFYKNAERFFGKEETK